MVPAVRCHGPPRKPAARVRLRAARHGDEPLDAGRGGQRASSSRTSSSLEPFRDRLNVVSGLHHRAADSTAVHSLSPTTWLSGVRPKPTQGVDAFAGVTADQIAAQRHRPGHAAAVDGARDRGPLRPDRRLRPRLRLHLHEHAVVAHADDADADGDQSAQGVRADVRPGRQRRRAPRAPPGRPQHSRRRHRASRRPAARARRARPRRRSTTISRTSARSSAACTRAESQVAANADIVIPQAPSGIPFEYEEHVRLMYDLLALAYQANITRVFTFMMAREVSNRTYPQVGVTEGHHAVSHHQNKPEKLEKLSRIQTFHIGLFGEFLAKLDATPDGDGSLLDHSMLLYGSNMSNSNAHDHFPLPNVLVGGGRGRLKGGQHIVAEDHTPMTNLLLTMLDKVGVRRRVARRQHRHASASCDRVKRPQADALSPGCGSAAAVPLHGAWRDAAPRASRQGRRSRDGARAARADAAEVTAAGSRRHDGAALGGAARRSRARRPAAARRRRRRRRRIATASRRCSSPRVNGRREAARAAARRRAPMRTQSARTARRC